MSWTCVACEACHSSMTAAVCSECGCDRVRAPACDALAALTLTPASAPYPGAEVHRWSVVAKHEDPNGVDASEVDRELAAAMQRELNGDEWEYASGRAGARWRKQYDHSAEAWRWHAEVRRV